MRGAARSGDDMYVYVCMCMKSIYLYVCELDLLDFSEGPRAQVIV